MTISPSTAGVEDVEYVEDVLVARTSTHDGAFVAMDLTACHPRTGELLSTLKFMGQTLATAGELQRELTYDGLRATEVKGSKGGRRRPAVKAENTDAVRTANLDGRSVAALAQRARRQSWRRTHGRCRPDARARCRRRRHPGPGAAGHP